MESASSPFKGGKTSDDGEKKGPLEKKRPWRASSSNTTQRGLRPGSTQNRKKDCSMYKLSTTISFALS